EVPVKEEFDWVSTSVQPADSPVKVALSVSSESPDALRPLSVTLAPPLHAVGPLKVGASATPLAVTVIVSDPVVAGPPAPSCEVTLRLRTAVSPPASGAVIASAPRSAAANVA